MTGRIREVSANRRVAIDRGWQVAAASAGSIEDPTGIAALRWVAAGVPGTAAGALRAAGRWSVSEHRAFDAEDWWWRVPIDPALVDGTAPPFGGAAGRPGAPLVLGFDGVATLWDAWIDGELAAGGDNMFLAREIDLVPGARELVIRCRALSADQSRSLRTTRLGRTVAAPCAAVGPWRPVWIERREFALHEIALELRIESGVGFIVVAAALPADVDGCMLVVTHGRERASFALDERTGVWHGTPAIVEPARWWPHDHGEPSRYGLALEASHRGKPIVIDLGLSGFRTVTLDERGLRVNDVVVPERRASWSPLDLVTLGAPRDAYAAAIAALRATGVTVVRVPGTSIYEDDALYDALDEHGVMLWQDVMRSDHPGTDASAANTLAEIDQQLCRLAGRPSLARVGGGTELDALVAARVRALLGVPFTAGAG